MALSNAQQKGFEKRLSKIRKGGSKTMGEVHVGPVDEAHVQKKGKPNNTVRIKKKRQKNIDLNSGSTAALAPLAVLIGGLAMFVGQAMDYQLFQDGGLINLETPVAALEPYMPYAPFLFGGILALMFAWTFRFNTFIRFAALMGGFVATFVYQDEIIRTLPFMYAGFFSEQFVKDFFEAAAAANNA